MTVKTTPRAAWGGEGPVRKFAVPQRKIDEPGRRITFTISTNARDRDGDMIDQAGWVLEEYQKNPVILWAHDGSQPPIARAETVSVENGKLVSIARFATREEYAFADTVFQLYKGGFLNATSVGFEPTEMELIEGEMPGDFGFRFIRQKLLEYSAVPIPSNPEALVVARGSGIDTAPCEKWVERILDERAAGSVEGLLNKTYIALRGRLHPALQAEIAARNVAALKTQETEMEKEQAPAKGMDEDEDDKKATTLTTGPGGEDGHAHSFTEGSFQTDPHEEDGHIHAITYTDSGEAIIEAAEGHGHDAPAAADEKNGDVDSEDEVAVQTPHNTPTHPNHDQPEGQRSAPARVVTDWPQPGMSMPVSLLTSEYRTFPAAEAKALREDWPEIWAMGKGPGEVKTEDDIRAREAWAAKHVDGYDLPAVVSQVRHLVRGSRGIEHMRLVLSKAKEAVCNERDKAKGLSAEEIEAITDRVVSKAVVPALEKAIRQHSGRVS